MLDADPQHAADLPVPDADGAMLDADPQPTADPPVPDADGAMTPKAFTAFEAYYALGAGRSLRKLAQATPHCLRQLERWSAQYDWPALVQARHAEEVAAARAAARQEAATLARRRLRNAQLMQEAALTIFSLAKLTDMEPEAARKALPDARSLLVEGMKAERIELGEATAHHALVAPPRPISEMSDAELADYIARLEHDHDVA